MANWNKWAAIGQIAGAVATFLAVVTSLYLARRADRPRGDLSSSIWLETSADDPANWPRFAAFMIRNRADRPFHVTSIGWRTGGWPFKWPKRFQRQHAIIAWWDPHQHGNPPFALAPFRRAVPRLALEEMLGAIEGMSGGPFFARKWPILGLQPTPIFAVVHLEEGASLRARVDQGLEFALFETEKRRAARQDKANQEEGPKGLPADTGV